MGETIESLLETNSSPAGNHTSCAVSAWKTRFGDGWTM